MPLACLVAVVGVLLTAQTYDVSPPRPGEGEQCIVCDKRVFDEDVHEVRAMGRTFFVGAPFLGDFEADPDRYFRKIQARSALFDEEAMQTQQMSFGWLWFGVYVLAGLVCGAVAAYAAVGKTRPPLPWFFAGLVGNVVAVVAIAVAPRGDASTLPAGIPAGLRKVPVTRTPSVCPGCGVSNHPAARRCSDCGIELTPTAEPEQAPGGGV